MQSQQVEATDSEAFAVTFRRILVLAGPVVLGEIGWMSMTVVDTVMVGSLGAAAIGATGIGANAFYTFAIFGMGLLFGLDTLVAQSWGAGNREDCHHSLMQGIYLALLLTAPLMALFAVMSPMFHVLGIVPEVSDLAGEFLVTLSLSTLPLLLYGALRRYLQSVGHVRPIMFTLVSANLINWFFNWLFIQGHWGVRAFGVVGSAMSTGFARVYMAALMAFFIWWYERGQTPPLKTVFRKPDWIRMRLLLKIGTPAAFQILLEIGAFGAAGILAGRLSANALAAHQIALNCAAVSYMVPLGVSAAAAVAVGQAIGRLQFAVARRSGYIAAGIASMFMTGAAAVFLLAPRQILEIYTRDAGVLAVGVGLLGLASCFQLFDGLQTVMTGALRGAGETRIPMLVNLGGYWAIGLPIGYLLCFRYRQGLFGLWWGLTIALVLISLILLFFWGQKSKSLSVLMTTPAARSVSA